MLCVLIENRLARIIELNPQSPKLKVQSPKLKVQAIDFGIDLDPRIFDQD